ncbi:MAG: hypothetical protein RLZZ592_1186 [Pseudomonadota bacterium]
MARRRSRSAAAAVPASSIRPSFTQALPLGALAAGFGLACLAPQVLAQQTETKVDTKAEVAAEVSTLRKITVKGKKDAEQGKDSLKATTTSIGKGRQALRDIPQSVTVLTERLMDDRNLDDFKDVLRSTAGVTFLAGETGEEDVRLRGFSLQQAGDIYIDGLRDSALYERDTFDKDRIEVLKGSASMLFGRGSTGGVVNQVTKQPIGMTQHEASVTLGTGNERRFTGDFNFKTGEDEALRVNAMVHKADNNGATVDKKGLSAAYRWGIGTADELTLSGYHLEYDNRPNYNHPWFLSNGTTGTIIPVLPADNYYGLASDYSRGRVSYATLSHLHRFADGAELKTTARVGRYERDIWVSAIRFGTTNGATTTLSNLSDSTLIARTPKGRYANSTIGALQSDYSDRFEALGLRHELLAGVDILDESAKRNNNFAGTASGLTTTVGTPNDGDWVADTRGTPALNTFHARTLGTYAQDTVNLSPTLKLLGGLRLDHFSADYRTAAGATFSRTDNLWSPRLGGMYQPDENSSYYVSYGTSFNTSGDTYQYATGAPSTKDANTPAEKSRNLEIGAKWDLFEQRANLGVALFRSEKYNERNTDPDSASTQQLLSGKRHATGMEFNLAGRINPDWDIFYNHTWIPFARIDRSNVALAASGTGAQVQGDRPALTPKHSASLWTTWRVLPKLRLGAGLNYRGEQNPEGARHVTAAAFTTVDAMAEYTFSERWSTRLNVSNLTNKLYADALYRGFYTPGSARSVQLTLKASL